MRSSLVGLCLLASAFSPLLAVLVLIVRPGDGPWLTVALVAVALAPMPVLALVLRALGQVQLTRLHTDQVRSRDQDVVGFVSSYVLPLAAVVLASDGAGNGAGDAASNAASDGMRAGARESAGEAAAGAGATDLAGSAATVLLLVFVALVYVRGGLYHLNPTLTLLGYRLYEVVQDNGAVVMVLSKHKHLPQQGEVDAHRLADGVLIQLGKR